MPRAQRSPNQLPKTPRPLHPGNRATILAAGPKILQFSRNQQVVNVRLAVFINELAGSRAVKERRNGRFARRPGPGFVLHRFIADAAAARPALENDQRVSVVGAEGVDRTGASVRATARPRRPAGPGAVADFFTVPRLRLATFAATPARV